jgi:hypothetical protein
VEPSGEVVFYLLLGDAMLRPVGDEEHEIVQSVERALRARYSLNVAFRVQAFNECALAVYLPEPEISVERRNAIHAAVQPPPIGGLAAGLSLPTATLCAGARAGIGAKGLVVNQITRRPGQRFVLTLECDTAEVQSA